MSTNRMQTFDDDLLNDDGDSDDDYLFEAPPPQQSEVAAPQAVAAMNQSQSDDDDDNDEVAGADGVPSGEFVRVPVEHVPKSAAVPLNPAVAVPRPISSGPNRSRLHLVGMNGFASNPAVRSMGDRRHELEGLRDLRRRDARIIREQMPLNIRPLPDRVSVAQDVRTIRERHTDLAVELPFSVVAKRDAVFRNLLLETLMQVRDAAEATVRDELLEGVRKLRRNRARAELQREIDDRGDENEDEPTTPEIDARVVDLDRDDPLPEPSDEAITERVAARFDPLIQRFREALAAERFERLPFVLEELGEYFELALDRVFARERARSEREQRGDAIPFDDEVPEGDGDEEGQFYEAVSRTYALSRMADEWLDRWLERRGFNERARLSDIDADAVDETRRAVVEWVTGTRALSRDDLAALPSVTVNDRRLLSLLIVRADFKRRFHDLLARANDVPLERIGMSLRAARVDLRARGAPFTSIEDVQAATRIFLASSELGGFEATLERDIARINDELSAIDPNVAIPLIIDRFVRGEQRPLSLHVRVEATNDVDDALAASIAYTFDWHRADATGSDRVIRTSTPGRGTQQDTLDIVENRAVNAPNVYTTAVGGYYYVVVRTLDVGDPTQLVSAPATVRIVTTCRRDGVVYEVAPNPTATFGECRWRTRPINAKRKRIDDLSTTLSALGIAIPMGGAANTERLDDASLLRLASLGREGARSELFTLDAFVKRIGVRVNDVFAQRYGDEAAQRVVAAAAPDIPGFAAILVAIVANVVSVDETLAGVAATPDQRAAIDNDLLDDIRSRAKLPRLRIRSLAELPVARIVTTLHSGLFRELLSQSERRFVDSLHERLFAFANAANAVQSSSKLLVVSLDALDELTAGQLLTTHSVWQSSRVRTGTDLERSTFLVDTEGERDFWRNAQRAQERLDTAATLRCDSRRLPVEAPFAASLRPNDAPLCTEADWRGIHSDDDDQPTPYAVEFNDDTGEVRLHRGSARIASGYDFDGLHDLIVIEVRGYRNVATGSPGWQGARILSRQRAQHMIHAYNILAFYAPNRGTAPFVRADEIMRRFSNISYTYSDPRRIESISSSFREPITT